METPPPRLRGGLPASSVTARNRVCPGVSVPRAGLQDAFSRTGFCSGGWCGGSEGGGRKKRRRGLRGDQEEEDDLRG